MADGGIKMPITTGHVGYLDLDNPEFSDMKKIYKKHYEKIVGDGELLTLANNILRSDKRHEIIKLDGQIYCFSRKIDEAFNIDNVSTRVARKEALMSIAKELALVRTLNDVYQPGKSKGWVAE